MNYYIGMSTGSAEYLIPYAKGQTFQQTLFNMLISRFPSIKISDFKQMDDNELIHKYREIYNQGLNLDARYFRSQINMPVADLDKVYLVTELSDSLNYGWAKQIMYDVMVKQIVGKSPIIIAIRPLFFSILTRDFIAPEVQMYYEQNKGKADLSDIYGAAESGYAGLVGSQAYQVAIQQWSDATSNAALTTFAAVQGLPKANFNNDSVVPVFRPEGPYPIIYYIKEQLPMAYLTVMLAFVRAILTIDDPTKIFTDVLKMT